MNNVIHVSFRGEEEKNGYSMLDSKLIGVINKSIEMEMCQTGDDLFQIFTEASAGLNREEMAEWLWMAAHMLDSEGRYKFDEYVGLNYNDKGE